MTMSDERVPLPENLPERGHHDGERVRSNNDQRDEMSEHRDPSHPTGWSPARPYDKDGGKDDLKRGDSTHTGTNSDTHHAQVREAVDSHLRRHSGR
jgi:hypothetical protein